MSFGGRILRATPLPLLALGVILSPVMAQESAGSEPAPTNLTGCPPDASLDTLRDAVGYDPDVDDPQARTSYLLLSTYHEERQALCAQIAALIGAYEASSGKAERYSRLYRIGSEVNEALSGHILVLENARKLNRTKRLGFTAGPGVGAAWDEDGDWSASLGVYLVFGFRF